jgi:hypothetical protein
MSNVIALEVTHAEQRDGRIEGFQFLWAFRVSGYRSDRHCQPCFRGSRVPAFSTKTASVGQVVRMEQRDHHSFIYVCGVSAGAVTERAVRNLHLPLRYKQGSLAELVSYNGYTFRAENAERIAIPALADDWNGLERSHARCKNFQLAVATFGYPSPA